MVRCKQEKDSILREGLEILAVGRLAGCSQEKGREEGVGEECNIIPVKLLGLRCDPNHDVVRSSCVSGNVQPSSLVVFSRKEHIFFTRGHFKGALTSG